MNSITLYGKRTQEWLAREWYTADKLDGGQIFSVVKHMGKVLSVCFSFFTPLLIYRNHKPCVPVPVWEKKLVRPWWDLVEAVI